MDKDKDLEHLKPYYPELNSLHVEYPVSAQSRIRMENNLVKPRPSYEDILNAVGKLKSSPHNPQYDPIREMIIDLFISEHGRYLLGAALRDRDISEAAILKLDGRFSEEDLMAVKKELCKIGRGESGRLWILKLQVEDVPISGT